VCGGQEDYEFLLGAIEHHAELGTHLVFDTTPVERARSFRKLPDSVFWVYDPSFGSGWKTFRFVAALQKAIALAEKLFKPEVLVQLDSDDFFSLGAGPALEAGKEAVVELQYVHWMPDGNPYLFGESEWHRRIWPAGRGVAVDQDPAWPTMRTYNGNPDTHPLLKVPAFLKTIRMDLLCRHHLHFALGEKAKDDEIAKMSITGWPHGGQKVEPEAWPQKLALWKTEGTLPSSWFV